MIFQWYSGSDRTGEIPHTFVGLFSRERGLSCSEKANGLKVLLKSELDQNWRGFFTYIIGSLHSEDQGSTEALKWFRQALPLFDPLAPNLPDVADEYCHTLYFLIEDLFYQDGGSGEIVALGALAIQALEHSRLLPEEKYLLYRFIGGAHNDLGNRSNLSWHYKAALGYYFAAHRLDPDEPSCLEDMIYTSYAQGDLEQCSRIYGWFEKVCVGYQGREKLEEFARTRLGGRANQ